MTVRTPSSPAPRGLGLALAWLAEGGYSLVLDGRDGGRAGAAAACPPGPVTAVPSDTDPYRAALWRAATGSAALTC
jgi:hypothetical protein